MTVQIVGDVSRDSSNDPIGSVYTPETPNKDLTPMQGGPRKADSQPINLSHYKSLEPGWER